MTDTITYDTLAEANAARQLEYGGAGSEGTLSLAYWGNAIAGEVGELCNVIKKLERERLGLAGSRDTIEHLVEEIADVKIYLALLEADLGIDGDAAVVAKFNATSVKLGFKTRLGAPRR